MHRSILTALSLGVCSLSAETIIFPQPKSVKLDEAKTISLENGVYWNFVSPMSKAGAKLFEERLALENIKQREKGTEISVMLDEKIVNEGYRLEITDKKINIYASSPAGWLYGLETLCQMIDEESVPTGKVEDAPRYGWRGLHLDESRHFFGKDFVKRYIDLMVMYKYNVFHWHLTDNDGWRIEIKKYPKLTEVGAFRKSVGRKNNQNKGLNVDDGKPYGGFYTQEEIKEIVAYAAERHVQIIPEIDVPGHSLAIIQSYPEFGAAGDVLNIGKKETITFLEDVYSELVELFPFAYVHIGCDEVGMGAWKKNADCIAKMKELGTDDPHDLHKWLVEHLQKFLAKKQRKAVAWCEVLDCKVAKDTVVMCWRDNNGWILAPKRGHQIVVCPSMQTYFNYQEDVNSTAPGHGGYRTTMQKVYNFDPTDDSLTAEQKKLVLGGQGCVWTEFIPKPEHVEFITFPRAIALSEALWSPKEKKNWEGYLDRLETHYEYLDHHKVNYRVAAPWPAEKAVQFVGEHTVKFDSPNRTGEIYFTTDGSQPTKESAKYTDGIKVTENGVVKAIVVLPNGRQSYTTIVQCTEKKPFQAPGGAKAQIDTNMRYHGENEPDNVFKTEKNAVFWTKHPLKQNHHFTVKFDKAVKLSQVEVLTGKSDGKDKIEGANLEVSYDNKTYTKIADFTGGNATGTPDKEIYGIRIKVIRPQRSWAVIREISLVE